jgi:hypothetical protein
MQLTDRVLQLLVENGMLLKQDKHFPNVVQIVTGESLSTSWWSHPKAHDIFAVLSQLADHPDVLVTKLLSTKDTLLHRGLWPSFLAVATAREPWQLRRLSVPETRLLVEIDRAACPVRASGAAAKQIQVRLLAHAGEVHTDSGRHEMALESWSHWSTRVGCTPARSVSGARRTLEDVALGLGASRSAFPWPAPRTAVG